MLLKLIYFLCDIVYAAAKANQILEKKTICKENRVTKKLKEHVLLCRSVDRMNLMSGLVSTATEKSKIVEGIK